MSDLCPVTLRTARQFVKDHHRHNSPPQGHKFSIGLTVDGNLIGVVIVGRPVARALDDGYTAEITRCCVLTNFQNANSKLYAAAIRAARAMGYRRIITYTLPEESGASLKLSVSRSTVKLLALIHGVCRQDPAPRPTNILRDIKTDGLKHYEKKEDILLCQS